MSYIDRIAYNIGRRDEVPNQDLAKELAENRDVEGISEIAEHLKDKNKSISSDCLKVLYEVGYIAPELIAPYLDEFVSFLKSKNNRMVWGSMIALANIAKVSPDEVYKLRNQIEELIETGSVITHIWGVYTLINLSANGYYSELKAGLLHLQKVCRPVDVAKRAESIEPVIQACDLLEFGDILRERRSDLSKAAQKRLDKVLKKVDARLDHYIE